MATDSAVNTTKTKVRKKPVCGIVMPISALDGCSAEHWDEVQEILCDAITAAGFTPSMVSEADDVGIIQKRIIQNLYDNPIAVCDVSGKNPNVMFELGMRLAFDKPTIIVKDDKTDYSFDTAPIEHVGYPRDLRFKQIVAFKESLAAKLKGTHAKAGKDPDYTTFLKHFGSFTVAKLDTKEVSPNEFILDELKSLRQQVATLGRTDGPSLSRRRQRNICVRHSDKDEAKAIRLLLESCDALTVVDVVRRSPSHYHFSIHPSDRDTLETACALARDVNDSARII